MGQKDHIVDNIGFCGHFLLVGCSVLIGGPPFVIWNACAFGFKGSGLSENKSILKP